MDLLHTLERDIKSEVDELRKALNVSYKSDINTTRLNKLNKGPLTNFMVNMLEMLDKNIDLSKSVRPHDVIDCNQSKSNFKSCL